MAPEDLPVPVFSTLEPVYGDASLLEEAHLRFDKLTSKFLDVFGCLPDVYARSPGDLIAIFSSLLAVISEF